MTDTDIELKETCIHLNSVRANFTACCEYPNFGITIDVMDKCTNETKDLQDSNCTLSCIFISAGILKKVTEDDGIDKFDIDSKFLSDGILLTIDKNPDWIDTVTKSSKVCYDQIFEKLGKADYAECFVPEQLYMMLSCVTLENVKNCPVWNPYSLEGCDYTRQYVEKCFSK